MGRFRTTERCRCSEQRPGGGRSLIDGVRPMLDAHRALEDRVVPTRDVARGDHDFAPDRAAARVEQYAVFEHESRILEP